jgi:hypothetical protein
MGEVVHKTTWNGPPFDDDPPFNDEQVDIVARALAALRKEFRDHVAAEVAKVERSIAELRDGICVHSEIAELRGAVTALLNKSADKSLELSATEVVRKVTRSRKS